MGVNKLWSILNDGGEGEVVGLADCSGESWAIDLSTWIVHGYTAGGGSEKTGVSGTYTMSRTVFYRALCLLKNGIRPVFVMDATQAPDLKSQTMNDRSERSYGQPRETGTTRAGLETLNNYCKRMLEGLGLKVVSSSGEAEKTCALLNKKGIVDACLTDDSDILLYGAKKVYRRFDLPNQAVEEHVLADIEEKVQLSQRDMVVMALLGGSDYGDGVKGIGTKKVMDLISTFRGYNKDEDLLTRVCGWRDNAELKDLAQKKVQLSETSKSSHCTKCRHSGTSQGHRSDGCSMCGAPKHCNPKTDKPCTCEYHKLESSTTPFTLELELRQKALASADFPDKQLVDEFLNSTENFDFDTVKVNMPNFDSLADQLNWTHERVLTTLIPVFIFMHLHGITPAPGATEPLKILRHSRQEGIHCYRVLWKQFEFDKWMQAPSADIEYTPPTRQAANNPYIINIPQEIFAEKYSEMIEQYQRETGGKRRRSKRSWTEESENKTDEIPEGAEAVKKRLDFEGETQPTLVGKASWTEESENKTVEIPEGAEAVKQRLGFMGETQPTLVGKGSWTEESEKTPDEIPEGAEAVKKKLDFEGETQPTLVAE